jgi:hypothetical protein
MPTRRTRQSDAPPAAQITLSLNPAHKRIKVRDLFRDYTGKTPAPPTIYRTVRGKGATGLRLPAVQVAGCWFSTKEAFEEWLELRSRIKPRTRPARRCEPSCPGRGAGFWPGSRRRFWEKRRRALARDDGRSTERLPLDRKGRR